MIHLRLIQPGRPAQRMTVEGDVATLGRSSDCDVVVNQPYISKRHLMILRGPVVVDLGSSNGTYVAGHRIEQATHLAGERVSVGQGEVFLEVESGVRSASAAPADVEAQMETLRSRATLLEVEAERLRRELSEARDTRAQDAEIAGMRGENQDLQRRLGSLKAQLEERESDDGSSLQARLAEERLETARARIADLERELAGTRAPAAADPAELERLRSRSSASEAELERLRPELELARQRAADSREQTETVRALREELERLRAERTAAPAPSAPAPAAPAPAPAPAPAAGGASELFTNLQRENRELRERIAALESGAAAQPADDETRPASDLFFQLQRENAELRRRVSAGGGGAAGGSAGAEDAGLRAEVERLRGELASARGPQAPAPGVAALLRSLVDQDVEGRPALVGGAAEEFLVLEEFRFLRGVEKVVTRMAGDFIQLYQLNTMLPDMEGNFRGLAAEVLAEPSESEPRDELMRYLEELRRWLVVSLAAHRQAAARFAQQIQSDLTETSLTAGAPIPTARRIAGQSGAELWKRASAYLKELSPDIVEDRIEKLARESARELLETS